MILKIIINKMNQENITKKLRNWEQTLTTTGSRLTAPRKAILEVIAHASQPLTPIEVFDLAREKVPNLGLVTVYRTLDKLTDLGLVSRVHGHNDCQTVFRAASSHQHLLICTNCGTSVYFDGLDAEERFDQIGRTHGYQVDGHWLQLYGLCADCRTE